MEVFLFILLVALMTLFWDCAAVKEGTNSSKMTVDTGPNLESHIIAPCSPRVAKFGYGDYGYRQDTYIGLENVKFWQKIEEILGKPGCFYYGNPYFNTTYASMLQKVYVEGYHPDQSLLMINLARFNEYCIEESITLPYSGKIVNVNPYRFGFYNLSSTDCEEAFKNTLAAKTFITSLLAYLNNKLAIELNAANMTEAEWLTKYQNNFRNATNEFGRYEDIKIYTLLSITYGLRSEITRYEKILSDLRKAESVECGCTRNCFNPSCKESMVISNVEECGGVYQVASCNVCKSYFKMLCKHNKQTGFSEFVKTAGYAAYFEKFCQEEFLHNLVEFFAYYREFNNNCQEFDIFLNSVFAYSTRDLVSKRYEKLAGLFKEQLFRSSDFGLIKLLNNLIIEKKEGLAADKYKERLDSIAKFIIASFIYSQYAKINEKCSADILVSLTFANSSPDLMRSKYGRAEYDFFFKTILEYVKTNWIARKELFVHANVVIGTGLVGVNFTHFNEGSPCKGCFECHHNTAPVTGTEIIIAKHKDKEQNQRNLRVMVNEQNEILKRTVSNVASPTNGGRVGRSPSLPTTQDPGSPKANLVRRESLKPQDPSIPQELQKQTSFRTKPVEETNVARRDSVVVDGVPGSPGASPKRKGSIFNIFKKEPQVNTLVLANAQAVEAIKQTDAKAETVIAQASITQTPKQ